MGIMHIAAATGKSPTSFTPILVIVVLFGLFYFLIIRPQRNKQRRSTQMQREVRPGQRVRTTAGIYGTITSVGDTDVEIEIAPGVEIRIMRRAIMDILSDDSPEDGAPGPGPDFGDKPADDWDSTDKNP